MKFLPVLRGARDTSRMEEKSVFPAAFASYYNDLAAAGIGSNGRGWTIERAVTEGYERIIWVFKSVNTIGADSARLPFRLRQGDDEVDDHPLYRVLNKKANPIETGQIFRKRLSAQVQLSKRGAFVEYTMSNGGTIKRMDLLPPDRTQIVPGTGNDLISHFRLNRKDGSYRNLDPQTVRWFRDPHPTDPYMGVTPLESAGLSVELDHFARLYNVSFMQNDGRPGGVLAVRKTDGTGGDIDPRQMDRIESRFGKGPIEAGKLSVIAGDLSYVDLATRPRDMQYGATSRNAKIEILSAFGVPESVLGYSAERTFDNADNELYVYWTRTLPAHHEILLTGFDEDSEDELTGYFDTSNVEVLERAERLKREEARTEFEAGLRSIWSYAKLAGLEDEIEETPHTRALYIASGRTPLPAREEDMEALGLGTVVDEPASGAPAVEGGAAPAAIGAAPAPAGDAPEAPSGTEAPALPAAANGGANPSSAAAVLAGLTGKHLRSIEGGRPKAQAVYRLSQKAATPAVESSPDLDAADALESSLASILAALATRWTERAVARLGSPKQRKGTRHWTPEYPNDTRLGTKALDAARAVDETTWQAEAEAETEPLLTAAAVAAAVALFADMGVVPPPGVPMATFAGQVVARSVQTVVSMIGAAAAGAAASLVADVNRADQEGQAIEDIAALVREQARGMDAWARGLAVRATTATIGAARNDAARETVQISPAADVITRTWVSRRDHKVRDTHAPVTGADGQTRGLDEPFIVGDSLLRWPGDPLAPLRETANCRCFMRHRMTRTGQFTAAPEAKAGRRGTDRDRDGLIFEGTPQERPALIRTPETRGPGASIRAQMLADVNWKRGYEQTHERMKGEPRDARERAARDLAGMQAAAAIGSGNHRLIEGALAALTDLHEEVDQSLSTGYDESVRETEPQHQTGTPLDYRGKFPGEAERLYLTEPGYTGKQSTGNFEGAPDDLTAYLDYSVVGDTAYIWFLTTRDDRKRQGLAGRLVADLYARHPDKTIEWGELMDAGAEMLYKRYKESHPDQTGRGRVYGRWMTGEPPPDPKVAALIEKMKADREAADAARVKNPDFGKRIGAPRKVVQANGSTIVETVGGRWEGQTVDRIVWRVEKRDGVWGVYPPTEQSPASFQAGTKREAEKWAMDRANGIPEAEEEPTPAKRSAGRVLRVSPRDVMTGDLLQERDYETGEKVESVVLDVQQAPDKRGWYIETLRGRALYATQRRIDVRRTGPKGMGE